MLWMWLVSAALAGSSAGMGLSPLGGGFSGITDPGVLGLGHTPAAARPEQPELAIDFGMSSWRIQANLADKAPAEGSGLTPIPYFAAALPIGPVGIGLTGMVPYGGGGSFPEDGAQRFHMVEGKVFMMEANLAVAYQPVDFLRLGVAGRFARGTMKKAYSVDSAGLLNGKLDPDPLAPEGDEFLEGKQELDVAGTGWGYAIGVSAVLPAEVEVHAAYRSPVVIPLSGPATVIPSQDLDLQLSGTARATMVYPRELALGVAVPIGRFRLMADGGWAGWSTMERVDGALEDVRVESNLNDIELTDAIEIYNDLGNEDVVFGGGGVDITVHERWVVRTGVWYAPTSIPADHFHVGIVDFAAWDIRGAVAWTPVDWLTAGMSLDVYAIEAREIRNSTLSLANEPETGRVLPSANGDYAMSATRFGLTLVTRM